MKYESFRKAGEKTKKGMTRSHTRFQIAVTVGYCLPLDRLNRWRAPARREWLINRTSLRCSAREAFTCRVINVVTDQMVRWAMKVWCVNDRV